MRITRSGSTSNAFKAIGNKFSESPIHRQTPPFCISTDSKPVTKPPPVPYCHIPFHALRLWGKHYSERRFPDAFTEEGIILNNTTETYYPQVSLILVPKFVAVCTPLQHGGVSVTDLKEKLNSAIPGMLQEIKIDEDAVKLLQDQLNMDMAKHLRAGELSSEMLGLINQVADLEARKSINNPINDNIRTSGKKELAFASFITPALKKSIVDFLDAQVKSNAVLNGQLKANNLVEANNKVIADYSQLLKYVGRQPLLTFGYLYTHGIGTVLSSHVGGLTFLQGFGKLRSDKIGQFKTSLTDTLSGNDPTGKVRNFQRNIIAFQAGYNQVLAVQKKLSIMELNVAAEGDWATNGYIKDTDRKRIYFDAYFRARLPSTPWVKLDLKYDPKDGNVFGLLNFTYNLDK
ncbi:MAG: hypothetical protein JWR38_5317 [Mucilaginibacter sp.]|nr:hypothetical protein [Mucilaginibacter sp.]